MNPRIPFIPEEIVVHLGAPNEKAKNITVSFPVNALKKTALMDKLTAPRGRFGFESDCNQNISVNEIINKSMIPGVEKMTDQYFNDFLGI